MHSRLVLILACLAMIAQPFTARAAAPAVVPIQGFLTDAAGTPIAGATQLKVALYTSGGAATPVYEETQTVTVTAGYFTLLLGTVTSLDLRLFADNGSVFVGISVGAAAEMAPRLTIGTTPYAAFAQFSSEAATLAGLAPSDLDALYAPVSHTHAFGSITGVPSGALAPAGAISMFGGAVPPAGYLLCDGAAVDRVTYDALFAAIGTTYGAGDGSTTFNLPNLKGKVGVGLNSAQAQFNALGVAGGEITHTLTSGEMPSHNHTGSLTSDGAHNHITALPNVLNVTFTTAPGGAGGSPYAIPFIRDANGSFYNDGAYDGMLFYNDTLNAYHVNTDTDWMALGVGGAPWMVGNVTSSTSVAHAHTATIGSTGGGAAHNTLQPYVVVNHIIKY